MKNLALPVIGILFFLTGCLGNPSDNQPTYATGIIEAEFVDAESGDPVANQEFTLTLQIENEDQESPIGNFTTNEDGIVVEEIAGQEEVTIESAIFEWVDENQEEQRIEEPIEFELRYDEPYDTVSLSFEI
ncbi:MAG: hypothetical protein WEA58_07035 [Balneolaceae bacterium]